jgi:hypothetical protein
MSPAGDFRKLICRRPRWHLLIVVVAVFCLTASLATRTFRLTGPHNVTIQSNSAQAMRQHMDRDAARWVIPAPVLTTLQVPTFYPHVAPAGPPLPSILFDKSLYNRPPPSSFC